MTALICQTLRNRFPTPAPTPGFQICIPTKIFQPNCLEDGRILLRCHLNLSDFLKGLMFAKLVFVEEDFKLILTPDPCKLESRLLSSADCQEENICHLLKRTLQENAICMTQMLTNGSKVHPLTP